MRLTWQIDGKTFFQIKFIAVHRCNFVFGRDGMVCQKEPTDAEKSGQFK